MTVQQWKNGVGKMQLGGNANSGTLQEGVEANFSLTKIGTQPKAPGWVSQTPRASTGDSACRIRKLLVFDDVKSPEQSFYVWLLRGSLHL